MAQQTINTGSTANDGTGDEIRDAWTKANANFTELYGGAAVDATNVEAAGALMDSEVVNLADVKAFDPAAYAAASHTHTASDVTDFNTAADARIAAASIGDLSDVVIAGVTDGQLLAWSNANSQFEATDPTAGGVTSVNGDTGAVVLDADDIDDSATTNKFTTTASVTAAGALMDSEVTNLAAVKSFDPANYATDSQGSTADTALQPALTTDVDAQGNAIGGFTADVVTGVSGALTTVTHSGKTLRTTGNVTIPTTTGFTCQLKAGGAHTVTFNGTTTAAMATGDLMTILVTSPTEITAGLLAVADQVGFS